MSCSASSACCCVSATTTATGSPAKRTRSVASTVIPEPGTMPEGCGGKWLSTSWGTQITGRGMIDATSGPVKTRTTPGADLAAEVSIDAIRAWPCGLRRIDAYAIPGRETSAMNLSSPRSMAGASVGGTEAPISLPSSCPEAESSPVSRVAVEPGPDLCRRGIGVSREQVGDGHHHARGGESVLGCERLPESFLDRRERAFLCESL